MHTNDARKNLIRVEQDSLYLLDDNEKLQVADGRKRKHLSAEHDLAFQWLNAKV